MISVKTVLTIAGSDSSGGAGIQGDIKTIAAHGLFGTSVITAITAQNSWGVQSSHALDPEVVNAQLESVLGDARPTAVKTGMLANDSIVDCVARQLKKNRVRNLVVDPVIRSSNRKALLNKTGVVSLKEKLLPLARLVTPNLSEAEVLSGVRIRSDRDRVKAAREILKTGVRAVLIKGGHAKGHADDFFFDGTKPLLFRSPRLTDRDVHGTGCLLSAAIASQLALGLDLAAAIERAKAFVRSAILGALSPGDGAPAVNPLADLFKDRMRFALVEDVEKAIEVFKEHRIGELIPEVQSNLGAGLPGAAGPEDVVAIPGRIIRMGNDVRTVASPRFGASRHVAKIVLTVMRFDPTRRAVMNIKFTDSILKACKKAGFKLATFDRADEPKTIKQLEGSSLEWGTHKAITDCGFVPDVIYDLGGQGKEEMIRVIAEDVPTLTAKILKIHQLLKKHRPAREKDRWRKR